MRPWSVRDELKMAGSAKFQREVEKRAKRILFLVRWMERWEKISDLLWELSNLRPWAVDDSLRSKGQRADAVYKQLRSEWLGHLHWLRQFLSKEEFWHLENRY